ncbi:MAG: hypothetical protein IT557_11305 [Alphaproteobacteria bacterium]|nr:hypothetical protein [Alphaproteobacteria bacterium]
MPVERIRTMADLSIRRACGFGALAIAATMVGFAFDPVASLRVGALGAVTVLVVLLFKAWQAPTRSYRKAEVWLLLDRKHGLPEARAQEIIGRILRERFMAHAEIAAAAALILWGLAFLLWLAIPAPE